MTGETEQRSSGYQFDAFISYRHKPRDEQWAVWLMRAIERYRLPPKLAREMGLPRKKRLRCFRDQEELPASSDLSRSIQHAMAASRHLIVICSPDTPESRWVRAEIARFRELGRTDRMQALLIEGSPERSFPPELTLLAGDAPPEDAGTHGVTGQREPLYADVRPGGALPLRRRKHEARLMFVAALLGCAKGRLRDRHAEHARRLLHQRIALSAVVLLALFGALGFALSESTEKRRARSLELAHQLAASAIAQYAESPERSLLLALQASEFNEFGGGLATSAVDRALRYVLQEHAPAVQVPTPPESTVAFAAYSRDGRSIAAVTVDARIEEIVGSSEAELRRLTGALLLFNRDDLARPVRTTKLPAAAFWTAFTGDGAVVTASLDGLRIWPAGGGQAPRHHVAADLAICEGHAAHGRIAAVQRDHGLIIVDLESGTPEVRSFPPPRSPHVGDTIITDEEIRTRVLSDRLCAYAHSTRGLWIYDFRAEHGGPWPLLRHRDESYSAFALAVDGDRLLVASVDEPGHLSAVPIPALSGMQKSWPEAQVVDVPGAAGAAAMGFFNIDVASALSEHVPLIAGAAPMSGRVIIWDRNRPDRTFVELPEARSALRVIAFSPDAKELMTVSPSRILLWQIADQPWRRPVLDLHARDLYPAMEEVDEQAESARRIFQETPIGPRLAGLELDASGHRVIAIPEVWLKSSGAGMEPGPIAGALLWDGPWSGPVPDRLGWRAAGAFSLPVAVMRDVHMDEQGRLGIFASDGGIIVVNLDQAQARPLLLQGSDVGAYAAVFGGAPTPDHISVFAGLESGVARWVITRDGEASYGARTDHPVTAVAYHRTPQYAAGDEAGHIYVWDDEDVAGEPITFTGGEAPVNALAFSPGRAWLAAGDQQGKVRLWRVSQHQQVTPAMQLSLDRAIRSLLFHGEEILWIATGAPRRRASTMVDFFMDNEVAELSGGGIYQVDLRLGSEQEITHIAAARMGAVDLERFADGRAVAFAGGDLSIRFLAGPTASLAEYGRSLVHRELSEEEWSRFIGRSWPYPGQR